MIEHDGWFPGVTLEEVRDVMRLGTTITDARLAAAIRAAMMTVTVELRDWKARQVAAGYVVLEAVPGDTIDWEPANFHLYKRAIGSFAAADLAETHNDITATGEGKDRIEERVLSADDHRRNGTHAIRDILGVGRTTVELI